MSNFLLGLNSFLFDSTRRLDRVGVTLLIVAVCSGIAGHTQGLGACVALGILSLSRRAT